jgi:hypothetical protein
MATGIRWFASLTYGKRTEQLGIIWSDHEPQRIAAYTWRDGVPIVVKSTAIINFFVGDDINLTEDDSKKIRLLTETEKRKIRELMAAGLNLDGEYFDLCRYVTRIQRTTVKSK